MSKVIKSIFSPGSGSGKKKSTSSASSVSSSPSVGRPAAAGTSASANSTERLERKKAPLPPQTEKPAAEESELVPTRKVSSSSSSSSSSSDSDMSSPKKSVDNLFRKFSRQQTGSPSPEPPSQSPSPSRTRAQAAALPYPVAELIRRSEELFATEWFQTYCPLFAKLAEWTLIYFLAFLGCGYGWVLFLATVHFVKYRSSGQSVSDTILSKLSALTPEKEVIGSKMTHFPAWVNFPDFDRVEWINDVLAKLWPNIGCYATQFVQDFVEPEVLRILDRMKLESVSGFTVKKIDVGKVPARVTGIKAYTRNTDRNEIVLDAEVVLAGDTRILFTLQGVQAEIKNIVFKGMARITLKPLLPTFPFIGGFEFYFINSPLLEYGLGGIGTFAEIPGANALVKAIVEDQIRSRFVWPNRFHLYFPINVVEQISDKSYLLAKPSGVLKIKLIEARDLLKKDRNIVGGGLSDPYATVKIGERSVSFRDKYVPKTVTPTWNYATRFIMEDWHGQEIGIEVFDWDSNSSDDFLGKTSLKVDRLVDEADTDDWLKLEEVKKGEIHVACNWKEAVALEEDDEEDDINDYSYYIVSFFVEACKGLVKSGSKSLPYPKCNIKHTQGGFESTAVKNKTGDPVFQEGFLFLSESLDTDNLTVEVADTKGSDSLGRVRVPLSFVKHSPRREFFNVPWNLEDGVSTEATIVLSAKLYGVK